MDLVAWPVGAGVLAAVLAAVALLARARRASGSATAGRTRRPTAATAKAGRAATAPPRSADLPGLRAVAWEADGLDDPPSWVSPTVTTLFGFPTTAVGGLGGLARIVHPDDRDVLAERRARLARGGVDDVVYRVVDARGRARWVHERVVVASRPGGAGAARGLVLDLGPGIDGAARRRDLDGLLDAVAVPLVVCRPAGHAGDGDEVGAGELEVVTVNEAGAAIVGDRDAAAGAPLADAVGWLGARGLAVAAQVAGDARARSLPGLLGPAGGPSWLVRAHPLPGVVVLAFHDPADGELPPLEPAAPAASATVPPLAPPVALAVGPPVAPAIGPPVAAAVVDVADRPLPLVDLDVLAPLGDVDPGSAARPAPPAAPPTTTGETGDDPFGAWGFAELDLGGPTPARAASAPPAPVATASPAAVAPPPVPASGTLVDRGTLTEYVHRCLAATLAGAGAPQAIVVLDLPGLADAEERLGDRHADLDALLVERLRAVAGPAAVVGRMGRDALAVVVPELDDAPAALAIAGRLVDVFDRPLGELAALPMVTAGVALAPEHGTTIEDLFGRADLAVQTARHTGIVAGLAVADQERSPIQRFALMGELHRAVEEDQFVLHYQPIVATAGGEVVSFEALIRWDHPMEGLLAPAEFLPLARTARLMPSLTRLAVRQVAATAAGWALAGHPASVSVNLDLASLRDDDLLSWLAATAQRLVASGSRLVLELAEADLLDDGADAAALAGQARAAGLEVAVEHVGTNAEGLAVVTSLELDEVKLHRSLGRLLADASAAEVVEAVRVAHGLGARVVAEGIETTSALERAADLGCDRAQGFLIAPPMPAGQVEALLGLGVLTRR